MNQEQTEALGVVTGTTSSSTSSISVFMCGPNQWHKQTPFQNILVLQSEIKNLRLFDTRRYFAMFLSPSGQNVMQMHILLTLK